MMRLPVEQSKREHENLLPLVNVVFLLLIFFMVAGAFSSPEAFNIQPVNAVTEKNADTAVLTILMNVEGELAIEDRIVSSEEVISIVQASMQNDSLKKVQLKSDANAEAFNIVELLEELAKTDLETLHILTSNQP